MGPLFVLVLTLLAADIVLLFTVARGLRDNAPTWVKLVPGGVLYAFLFRRDLLR
jgi:hypothetical protein